MGEADPNILAKASEPLEPSNEAPEIYVNGFGVGLSPADVNITLIRSGQPVGRLYMSFTSAKSLLEILADMMEKLEEVTEHKIMTSTDVQTGLEKIKSDQKK